MRYQWRPGSRFAVKASAAGQALEAVRAENDGQLRPPDVVAAARDEAHALHPAFEWDDEAAAESYRLVQARQIIHCLITIESRNGENHQEVAYVHTRDSEGKPFYSTSVVVLSDEQLRDAALAEALALLKGVQRRYDHLEELSEVFKTLEAAEARARARKPKTKTKPRRRPAAAARRR